MRTRSALALLFMIGAVDVLAQCPIVTVGTYDGSPVDGNLNTPFPTDIATGNRGFRVQYIYPASELADAGMCPGNITGFTFYSLENESQAPLCALTGQIRMGSTAQVDFAPGLYFIDGVQAAEPMTLTNDNPFVNSNYPAGPITWSFASPFYYDLSENLVLEITWSRSVAAGVSPRVQLQEDLEYHATRLGIHPTNPASGGLYDDEPTITPAGLTVWTTMNRPITTFQISDATAVNETSPTIAWRLTAEPGSSSLLITRPITELAPWSIVCSDAAGRQIATATFAQGTSELRVGLPARITGVVLVSATDPQGNVRTLGRVAFAK